MALRLFIHSRPRSEDRTEVLVTPTTTSHELIQILRVQSPIIQDNQFGLMISNIRNKCRWIEEDEELGKIIINEDDTIFIQPHSKLLTIELPGSRRVKVKVNMRIQSKTVVKDLCHRFHIWPYEIWGAFMDARGENIMLRPYQSISEEAPDIEKIYLKQYLFPLDLRPEILSPTNLYIMQYRQMILNKQFGESENDLIILKGKEWYNKRNINRRIPVIEHEKKKELQCFFSLQTFGQIPFQLRFHDTVGNDRWHTRERVMTFIISHSSIIATQIDKKCESMHRPFSTIKNVGVREGLVRITFTDDQEWHLTSHRYSEIACILCNLMNKYNSINPPSELADFGLVLPESIQPIHLEMFNLPNQLYSTEELIRDNMISLTENYMKFAQASSNGQLDGEYIMAENRLNATLEELLGTLKVNNASLNAIEIVTSMADDLNNLNGDNSEDSQKQLRELENKLLKMNEMFCQNGSRHLFDSINNTVRDIHLVINPDDCNSDNSLISTTLSSTVCPNHVDALHFVTFEGENNEETNWAKKNRLMNHEQEKPSLFTDPKVSQIIISSEYYYDISSDSEEYQESNPDPNQSMSTSSQTISRNYIIDSFPTDLSTGHGNEMENNNANQTNSHVDDQIAPELKENEPMIVMDDSFRKDDMHRDDSNVAKQMQNITENNLFDSKVNQHLTLSEDSEQSLKQTGDINQNIPASQQIITMNYNYSLQQTNESHKDCNQNEKDPIIVFNDSEKDQAFNQKDNSSKNENVGISKENAHYSDSKVNRKFTFSSDSEDMIDQDTLTFPNENLQQNLPIDAATKVLNKTHCNRTLITNTSTETNDMQNDLIQHLNRQETVNSEKTESISTSSQNENDQFGEYSKTDEESSDFEIASPFKGKQSHAKNNNHTLALFSPTKELYKHKRNPSFFVEDQSSDSFLGNTAPVVHQTINMNEFNIKNEKKIFAADDQQYNRDSSRTNSRSRNTINRQVDTNINAYRSVETINTQQSMRNQYTEQLDHQQLYGQQSSPNLYASQSVYSQNPVSIYQPQQMPTLYPQQGMPVPCFPQVQPSYSQVIMPSYPPSPNMFSPSPYGSPNCHVEASPNIVVNVNSREKSKKKKNNKKGKREHDSSDASISSNASEDSESINSEDAPTVYELIEGIQGITHQISCNSDDWKSAYSETNSLVQFLKKLAKSGTSREIHQDLSRLIQKGQAILKQMPKKTESYLSFAEQVEQLLVLKFDDKLKEIQSSQMKSIPTKTKLQDKQDPELDLALLRLQTSLSQAQLMSINNLQS